MRTRVSALQPPINTSSRVWNGQHCDAALNQYVPTWRFSRRAPSPVPNVESLTILASTHRSGENGARESLAILDGITSSVVISSFKPDSEMLDAERHSWAQDSRLAYIWILEQLDRYWALALAHTSSRTVPQHSSDVIAVRLKQLAQLSIVQFESTDPHNSSPMGKEKHSTLMNAIIIAERSWKHPVIIQILQGKCTDKSYCEPQVVQQVIH